MDKIFYLREFKESDLEPTKSFRIKTELEPNIWSDFKLNNTIKNKLMSIVNEYISTIDIGVDFEVKDIIFIGSLASYNWSKYSDFDIHIVIDYKKINPNIKLVEEFFDLHRKVWNDNYNIDILGYDVELYIENYGRDMSHINGVYSLLKEKWNKKPSPLSFEPDEKMIEQKAIDIMELIDDIEDIYNEAEDVSSIKEKLDRVWDKIKKNRRDGFESPDGEFAIGNLVFKFIRRNGYIEKVIELKKKIIESKYSLDKKDIKNDE